MQTKLKKKTSRFASIIQVIHIQCRKRQSQFLNKRSAAMKTKQHFAKKSIQPLNQNKLMILSYT